MAYTITAAEFKAYFDRGQFDYGPASPDIRDKDIDRAVLEALAVMNQDLFDTEDACKLALSYLAAHFLYTDTESDGAPSFNQTSRSADGLSESVHIPAWMMEGDFAFYSTTYYGQKYLQLIAPYLGGSFYAVGGATLP